MAERDNISVEHSTDTSSGQLVHRTSINDHLARRAWTGESVVSQSQASTEATRKMLGDRRAREYVGEP
jgi:hypothetical protein